MPTARMALPTAAYALDPRRPPAHLAGFLGASQRGCRCSSRQRRHGHHLLSAQQPAEIDRKTVALAPSPLQRKPEAGATTSTSPPTTHGSPIGFFLCTPSFPPTGATTAIFGEYTEHGIWHILTGYEHMLFMAYPQYLQPFLLKFQCLIAKVDGKWCRKRNICLACF